MPDVFVAPEDKPARSRTPVSIKRSPQHSPPQEKHDPQTKDTIQPQNIPVALTPTRKNIAPLPPPPVITPVTAKNNVDDVSSKAPEKPLPPSDDIERRNGMLPLVASFWENPRSVFFDTQEPDEHILLFLRRHFITNFGWLFFTLLFLFLPLIITLILHLINYPTIILPMTLLQVVLILFYLLVITNAYVNFLDWYYNISIISSKRVLDIQLKDLVNKKVSETKLSLIQDVDFKQTGTLPSLFNFGDVIMQTAGKEVNFVADAVPNPEHVVHIVSGLIGKPQEVAVEEEDNATI